MVPLPGVPGTLTQNEMVFKRLHLGTVAYGLDSMDEVQSHIFSIYTQVKPSVLIQSLGREDPLEKEMATQYSCLENSMERRAW